MKQATMLAGGLLVALTAPAHAQCPAADYYASVDASNPSVLRSTLHQVVHDHVRQPYTSNWSLLESADQDPVDSDSILDVYYNQTYLKVPSGRPYSREHTWPRSYGFPTATQPDGGASYPFADCHALFLSEKIYNSNQRHNRPYMFCEPSVVGHECVEKETVFNQGRGGSAGSGYPGWSNWRSSAADGDTRHIWETWRGRRGDVARALFYLDVRYEGHVHTTTSVQQPDLVLVPWEEREKVVGSTTEHKATGYMGMLDALLEWHLEDPVDDLERTRNDVVCDVQRNRNPFIDNPGWAWCLYLGLCQSDLTISKSDGVSQVVPGETLFYTLEASNAGPDPVIGALVTDAFDVHNFDLATVAWSCAPSGSSLDVSCPASGDAADLRAGVPVLLGPGGLVRFTVTATVRGTANNPVWNRASIDPPAGLTDTAPADNFALDFDALVAPGSCGHPGDLLVSDLAIGGEAAYAACHSITVTDFRVVLPAGDVTLTAGDEIALAEGFAVEEDCRFQAALDPSLSP